MKVFLSWSGPVSKQVAQTLREWLPLVLQGVQPYMSSEDIDKGTRWNNDIAGELEKAAFGIICVTADNTRAPWLNFEAGALSRRFGKGAVAPLLFDLTPGDLEGPLLSFQGTIAADKDDMKKLVSSLNKERGEQVISDEQLKKTFEQWWPQLEVQLREIAPDSGPPAPTRPADEMLGELLELARGQTRSLSALASKVRRSETDFFGMRTPAHLARVSSDAEAYESFLFRVLDHLREQGPVDVSTAVERAAETVARRDLEDAQDAAEHRAEEVADRERGRF